MPNPAQVLVVADFSRWRADLGRNMAGCHCPDIGSQQMNVEFLEKQNEL